MSDRSEFGLKALLRNCRLLVLLNRRRALVGLVAMTAAGVVLDLKADNRTAGLLFPIVGLVFQVWLTIALLHELGKRKSVTAGSGTVIGVLLISQIGILLGLLLLVVPGVIAFVRWSIVVPVVLSDQRGTGAALTESWYRTEGHCWPILALFAIIYIPMFVIGAVLGILIPPSMIVQSSVLVNLVVTSTLILGWHGAVAIFLASEAATPAP